MIKKTPPGPGNKSGKKNWGGHNRRHRQIIFRSTQKTRDSGEKKKKCEKTRGGGGGERGHLNISSSPPIGRKNVGQ